MMVGGAPVPGGERIGPRGTGADPQPGSGERAGEAHVPEGNRPDSYCAVTIVSDQRQVDVALPTSVCVADLLPGLLRLLLTEEPDSDGHLAQARPWALTTIAGRQLSAEETLAAARVLVGDVLMLKQDPLGRQANSPVVVTRDRVEDVVSSRAQFWAPAASRIFAQWLALLVGALLLVPAISLRTDDGAALIPAIIALIVTVAAVLAGRRSENACAAAGLALGCGWAALAGAIALHPATTAGAAGADPVTLIIATGSALLLAACALLVYPAALIHATALLVAACAGVGLVVAVNAGASVNDAGCTAALSAALLLGALPRGALAVGGLTGSEPDRSVGDLDDRITRADRFLTGGLIGVSLVAAGGAIPAALASDGWSRTLAVGIALLLLLRSRAYSQTPHVFPPRIGGLMVLGAVWLGGYLGDTASRSALVIGAVVATTGSAMVIDVLQRSSSPVGRARRARLLDLAEQFAVVAMIVLTAWVVMLADWVTSVGGW